MSGIRNNISNPFKRGHRALRRLFRKSENVKTANSNLAVHQVMQARKIRPVPTAAQLKHFPRLLSKTEKRLAIVALVTLVITGFLLAWRLTNSQRVLQPAVGGEYTEGLIGSPQLINPLYALTSDVDTDLTRLVFSGLMRYDIHQGLVPDLAESYEINDDQTVYRLTVRDDARWHDGRPVRAADVIFTVSAIQNTGYRSPLEVSFAGITVEQIDERTVQFTLSEPFAPFLSLLTVGILPSHLWENISPVNASVAELNKKPIGSGPYKFEKFVKDTKGNIRSYTFVRNSDYYLGAPYIEKLHFKFYPDMTAALEALRNHNIEGLSFLPLEAIPDFEDDNKLQILFPSLQQYTAAFFNPEHQEILDETEVREALVLATDKDALVEKVLGGYGHTVDSFILEGMVGEHPDIRKIGYDKEAASAKLEEAGWELAEGSEVRTKDGTELDLTIVTLNSSELTATANELKNQWSQIGVRVAVSAVDSTTFQNDILKNRGYDILISGELYGIDPDPYAFWHSSQTEFPGLNLAQFSNRKADELIEQARGTSDLAQRAQAYRDLQDLVAKDIAAIFLYQPAYSYVSSSKIQNVDVGQIVIPADRFANINTWYIKTKKVFVKVDTENES